MLYLDTSLLVAFWTAEAETKRVQAWVDAHRSEGLVASDWTATEFSAALSIKLRRKAIASGERDQALTLYRRTLDGSEVLSVTPSDFRVASQLADRYELGLRGGDALHLAVAARGQATLCTLDKGQAEAGRALAIRTLLVSKF